MNERPSRDSVMLTTAFLMASRSTCSRASVGAVFAKKGRILSTGYNGAPAGLDHCDHSCDCNAYSVPTRLGSDRIHQDDCRSKRSCLAAIHAEANAVAWAARCGVSLKGSTLYVTYSPCRMCALLLLNTGLKRVVFSEKYETDKGEGLDLLYRAKIELEQLSTEIIDFRVAP